MHNNVKRSLRCFCGQPLAMRKRQHCALCIAVVLFKPSSQPQLAAALLRATTTAATPTATTPTPAAATAALVPVLAVSHLNSNLPNRPGGRGIIVIAV